MKQRIITGLTLIAIVCTALWVKGIPLDIMLLFLVMIASHEVVTIFKEHWPKPMRYIVPILAGILLLITLFAYQYIIFSIVVFIIFLSLLVICCDTIKSSEMALVVFMHILIIYTILGLTRTLETYGFWMIIYIGFATYGCDAGAYFFGSMFGKHKLNARISPHKTIEGSIGGIVTGFILSMLIGIFVVKVFSIGTLAFISLCMCINGQIGDLFFSAVKREYEIKDYGNIFPGHGGVLDRIDSLIFNMMFFLAVINLVV